MKTLILILLLSVVSATSAGAVMLPNGSFETPGPYYWASAPGWDMPDTLNGWHVVGPYTLDSFFPKPVDGIYMAACDADDTNPAFQWMTSDFVVGAGAHTLNFWAYAWGDSNQTIFARLGDAAYSWIIPADSTWHNCYITDFVADYPAQLRLAAKNRNDQIMFVDYAWVAPEPSSLLALLTGCAAVGGWMLRRRR